MRVCLKLALFFGAYGAMVRVAAADSNAPYLESLEKQVLEEKTASSREWLSIGHWLPRAGGGFKSEIDGHDHFLAPDGKTNPQAEILATLRAMALPIKPGQAEKTHAQCRYPSRREFLYRTLPIDPARLPRHPCPEQRAWKNKLNADSVSIVFASSYLNNAASMFGHTFIKFHSRDNRKDQDLLNYGVNFAANTGADGGVPFAIKGLFGFYPGTFSLLPYHQTLKAYANLEGRDVWEYQLNLAATEVEKMIDHLLELEPTYFDYYFFDENCSYQLLTLLEVVRPELKISDRWIYWIIPAATLHVLTEVPGLVQSQTYRPALVTYLQTESDKLDRDERWLARQLVRSSTKPQVPEADREHQLAVLDTALFYASTLEYQDPPRWQQRNHQLRVLRAPLGQRLDAPEPPPTVRPEFGHQASRAGLGFGQRGETSFHQVQVRAAYHDLLSNDEGFLANTQMEIMRISLRLEQKQDTRRLRLQEVTLFDLLSTTPLDIYFQRWSWQVDGGLTRPIDLGEQPAMVGTLNAGFGAALSPFPNNAMLLYGLARVLSDIGEDLKDHYRLGFGPQLGALLRPGPRLRLLATSEFRSYVAGAKKDFLQTSVKTGITIARNWEFRAGYTESDHQPEWQAGLFAYFLF